MEGKKRKGREKKRKTEIESEGEHTFWFTLPIRFFIFIFSPFLLSYFILLHFFPSFPPRPISEILSKKHRITLPLPTPRQRQLAPCCRWVRLFSYSPCSLRIRIRHLAHPNSTLPDWQGGTGESVSMAVSDLSTLITDDTILCCTSMFWYPTAEIGKRIWNSTIKFIEVA